MLEFDLTPDDFRAEFFEQKPRHFPGALVERPVTWRDIDELLHILQPGLPIMRMFYQGQLPDHEYTEEFSDLGISRRRLRKSRFYEYMARGATLQINWLEQNLLAAKRLCLEVGRYAGARTSSNAYMSFAGDGSFGKHWDTHDVFVIQLIGRKRWRIYEPTFPLPLTYQTHDGSEEACPSEPVIEFTIEEGDMIYLPRGWWHHVIPLDAGSFHLSVGTYAPSLFDYIVQTSAKYLEQQLAARRSFSPSNYRAAVSELLQQLPEVLLDDANAAAFQSDSASRERVNSEHNLASLDSAAAPLGDDALLTLTTFDAPVLVDGIVLVNGKKLRLEPLNQAIVAALRDVPSMRLKDLCARLGDVPAGAVHHATLELARYDLVTIEP